MKTKRNNEVEIDYQMRVEENNDKRCGLTYKQNVTNTEQEYRVKIY